jgi:hypothetical protein
MTSEDCLSIHRELAAEYEAVAREAISIVTALLGTKSGSSHVEPVDNGDMGRFHRAVSSSPTSHLKDLYRRRPEGMDIKVSCELSANSMVIYRFA